MIMIMNAEKQYQEQFSSVIQPKQWSRRLSFVDCRPQAVAQAELIRNIQLLRNDRCFNKNVIQCSKLGKFCTALGAGALGTLGFLLGGIPGAAIASGGYLFLKQIVGGPFIGGKRNIDILQTGGSGTIGIGHINKTHCPSHTVGYVNGIGYDQTIDRQTNLADVDYFQGFNPVRGRVASVQVPKEASSAVLNGLEKVKRQPTPYSMGCNNCVTNVKAIHSLSGLKSPIWTMTPRLYHFWAKIMSGLQKRM